MKKVKLTLKTYPSTLEVYFSDEEKSVSVGSLSISTEVDFEIYDNPEDALEFEVGSVRDRILDFSEDNSFVLDDSSLDSELSKVESYYSLRVSDYFSKEV
jgi:hypothetical protein